MPKMVEKKDKMLYNNRQTVILPICAPADTQTALAACRNQAWSITSTMKKGMVAAMPNLKYIFSRIANMHYGAMIRTARTVHERSDKSTIAALCDIIRCGLRYQAGYMDYLVFEFYTLNDKQRETYITRGRNNDYVKLLNPRENWGLLENKVEFLKRFDGFHGRAWIDLRECDEQAFLKFCASHRKLVAKPLDGTCGRGIEFIETSDKSKIAGLYEMLKSGKQYLVEDYIIQHPDISRIYPLSVNTLRLVTIRNHDTVHLVFSSMRIGNGKPVDNLNSGGMAVIVDMDTGKISTPGADKDGKAYERHPMTGVKLQGQKIPMYKDAVAMVKRAAMQIPELGYIGWDVAVTQTHPLIIEANHFPGHDIYQFQVHLGPDKIGLKPRFDRAIENL